MAWSRCDQVILQCYQEAAIIEDKPGDFGHYIIYELLEM